MVDFGNENTITQTPGDIVKILFLEARANCIIAIEDYKRQELEGRMPTTGTLTARLMAWFCEAQGALKRKMTSDESKKIYAKMEKDFLSNNQGLDFDVCMKYFFQLNEYADEINLTRIETKKRFDSTRAELENKERGY